MSVVIGVTSDVCSEYRTMQSVRFVDFDTYALNVRTPSAAPKAPETSTTSTAKDADIDGVTGPAAVAL